MDILLEHPKADLDVAIIGAGFSGLCMAIALNKVGYQSFRIFEEASELGGTWRDNRYPGCACDVPSHLYSYSFAQNPNWSRSYSPQAEIWRYMKDCASKYRLESHFQFSTTVTSVVFDEATNFWRIALSTGERLTARAVVSAVGALHLPAYPKIERLSAFAGQAFHSSHWNESLDLTGRNVGVIGTGASAIQIVPAIAPKVRQLTLFQRTPAWVLPRGDYSYSDRAKAMFRFVPGLQRAYRTLLYWQMEMRALGFLGDRRLMRKAEKISLDFLKRTVRDPKLREALTPDYQLGCKRVLISDDYFAAFNRPNVKLETTPISRASYWGLETEDGTEHALDTLIYATGFRANDPLAEIHVEGRRGHTLAHDWRYGAEAYYGISVAGYPNFFMLLGPNSGLGHNSMIFMIESQVNYVMDCLGWLLREGAITVEVRRSVQENFNANLRARMKKTVWLSGCRSWYLNENGSNSAIWPDFTFRYWWKTRNANPHDYAFTIAESTLSLA